jgi:hypothetical protein
MVLIVGGIIGVGAAMFGALTGSGLDFTVPALAGPSAPVSAYR